MPIAVVGYKLIGLQILLCISAPPSPIAATAPSGPWPPHS